MSRNWFESSLSDCESARKCIILRLSASVFTCERTLPVFVGWPRLSFGRWKGRVNWYHYEASALPELNYCLCVHLSQVREKVKTKTSPCLCFQTLSTSTRRPQSLVLHGYARTRGGTLLARWAPSESCSALREPSQVSSSKQPSTSSSGLSWGPCLLQNDAGFLCSSLRTQRGHGWARIRHSAWKTAPQPSHLKKKNMSWTVTYINVINKNGPHQIQTLD